MVTGELDTFFLADVSSIKRRRVKIGTKVDLCRRKPFWLVRIVTFDWFLDPVE